MEQEQRDAAARALAVWQDLERLAQETSRQASDYDQAALYQLAQQLHIEQNLFEQALQHHLTPPA